MVSVSVATRREKRLDTTRLTVIIVFVVGVIVGSNFGHFFPNDLSSSKALPLSDSIKSDKLSFQAAHSMTWTIPEHIAHQRDEECANSKISKTGGFCLTKGKYAGGNNMVDEPMANFLADVVFRDKTVVDLGAGLGHYGEIFKKSKSKVDWVGYDGAINVQGATDGLVKFMDLTQPHALDERPCVAADWVLSLEVAEHIPVEHTDSFLRNVRCHARQGAVISWALPTQTGGLGHVNMREEKDAIDAVEKWGFKVDWDLTNRTRAAATIPHFKKTPVVYRVIV